MTKTPWSFDGPLPRPDPVPGRANGIICPNCSGVGMSANAMTAQAKKHGAPRDGDPMICVRCKTMMIYDESVDGLARLPLASEEREISNHPSIRMAKHAIDAMHDGRPVPLIDQEHEVIDEQIERIFNALQHVRDKMGIPQANIDVICFVIDHAADGDRKLHMKATKRKEQLVDLLSELIDNMMKAKAE